MKTQRKKSKPANAAGIIPLIVLLLSITACQSTPVPLSPLKPPFPYYGWIYVSYTANDADLARIRTYTNTGFAVTSEQVRILEAQGFENVFYLFNEFAILDLLWKNEGKKPPAENQGTFQYEKEVPQFREKFFRAYKEYIQSLKESLLAKGIYDQVDIFYIADEPALHRNIFLDQDFLDRYVAEFKEIFPDKKSAIAFANEWTAANNPGVSYDPPADLDLVIVDPYFSAVELGMEEIPCDREKIKEWLYQGNPISSIGWAKRFDKPILVAGDAQLKNNRPPKGCYLKEMYAILQDDPAVTGLIWFIYDKGYNEGGTIRGGGNSPHLVSLIENLGR